MITSLANDRNERLIVHSCITAFISSVAIAYIISPHWLTISYFALNIKTLPFFLIAMASAATLVWYAADQLRAHKTLRSAGNILRISALSIGIIVLVPTGNNATKGIHDVATLCFVLLAAIAFLKIAHKLRSLSLYLLMTLNFLLISLELVFIIRYDQHPIYPWVWVVLQLTLVGLLLGSLIKTLVLLKSLKLHTPTPALNRLG